MAIKLKFRGIDVTTSSAAEAAELLRELTATTKPAIKRSISPDDDSPKNGFDVEQACFNFLTIISRADRHGTTAEDLMSALHVIHPKGIGGRTARINGFLSNLGFAPHEVYDNSRTAEGRFWKPGRRLAEVIGVLEKRLAEQAGTG